MLLPIFALIVFLCLFILLDALCLISFSPGSMRPPDQPENVAFFGGSKAPPPPKEVKVPEIKMPELPPPPPPPKPPPPPDPPTIETKQAVEQSMTDAKRQEKRRQGLSKTLLAGETGGYSDSGKKTLLG
jgi:type IV secretory pathway VirB10-like protein